MRAGAFAPGYERVRAAGRLRVDENTEKSPHLRGIALIEARRVDARRGFRPWLRMCARGGG